MDLIQIIRSKQNLLRDHIYYHDGKKQSPFYCNNQNDDISEGCQSCKAGTWWCFYVGHKCNTDCFYCPQGSTEFKNSLSDDPCKFQHLYIDDIKYMLELCQYDGSKHGINGISYSGGEPFLYIQKIVDMASYISLKYPHIYQWMYTNGKLATVERMQRVRDAGIREIRFHLQATNFDSVPLRHLEEATKIFDIVAVENPSTSQLYDFLVLSEKLKWLTDIGIYQLNCSELFHHDVNWLKNYFDEDQLYYYDSIVRKDLYSPTSSRILTYQIMEYAHQNNLNIIINDCNHESRDLQLITRQLNQKRTPQMY